MQRFLRTLGEVGRYENLPELQGLTRGRRQPWLVSPVKLENRFARLLGWTY